MQRNEHDKQQKSLCLHFLCSEGIYCRCQDGNSRTALLCCCSPSPLNASESLSTLRFGVRHVISTANSSLYEEKVTVMCWLISRAKHIRPSYRVQNIEDNLSVRTFSGKDEKQGELSKGKDVNQIPVMDTDNDLHERLLLRLRADLNEENVKLLEELFKMEGILFDPYIAGNFELAFKDTISRTITLLHATVEDQAIIVEKLKRKNIALKREIDALKVELATVKPSSSSLKILGLINYLSSWVWGSYRRSISERSQH